MYHFFTFNHSRWSKCNTVTSPLNTNSVSYNIIELLFNIVHIQQQLYTHTLTCSTTTIKAQYNNKCYHYFSYYDNNNGDINEF